MEPMREAAHFLISAIDLFFYFENISLEPVRLFRSDIFDGLKGKIDSGEGLAYFVVQFPCNSPPLCLLGVKQPGGKHFEFFPMAADGLSQSVVFNGAP